MSVSYALKSISWSPLFFHLICILSSSPTLYISGIVVEAKTSVIGKFGSSSGADTVTSFPVSVSSSSKIISTVDVAVTFSVAVSSSVGGFTKSETRSVMASIIFSKTFCVLVDTLEFDEPSVAPVPEVDVSPPDVFNIGSVVVVVVTVEDVLVLSVLFVVVVLTVSAVGVKVGKLSIVEELVVSTISSVVTVVVVASISVSEMVTG